MYQPKYNNGYGSEIWSWDIKEVGPKKFHLQAKGDKDPFWWDLGYFPSFKKAFERFDEYNKMMLAGGYAENDGKPS